MHHHVTEDTPPDMLAGAMDLVVRLPDGRDVNMAVERSTPMMDLLVHLTTANKLKPSDHLLQALDMSTDRTLPYKPNTPIGALDTQRVRVIPKGSGKGLAPRVPVGQQPFESTFRLQVHLPRNQFCVIRVGKYVLLEDIMKKVCEEKNLDPKKYEFRHPANIDKVLDPKRTLNDYEITEITVVHRASSGHLSQALSSTDIMALQREDERRKMQAKTGGGVLNLIFKRGRNSMGSGSISSDTRSISPTQSDDSRSVTPPAITQTMQAPVLKSPSKESVQAQNRPKPPQRKRRPAPKPPAITQSKSLPETTTNIIAEVPQKLEQTAQEAPAQKLENGLTICHSRNSSDSSGYHEASILSENCNTNTTLPRRPKSIGVTSSSSLNNNNSNISMEQKHSDFRKSTGNLANMAVQSKSTISLTAAGRKKKAPPPPPSLSSANSAASIASSISSPPNSDIAEVVVNASSIRRVVELPKSHSSDNETATLTTMVPKPKPRTIKTPAPVPTPRRVFTEPVLHQTKTDTSALAKEKPLELDTSVSRGHAEGGATLDHQVAASTLTPLRKDSNFDTVGRTRGFQIGQSMLSIDSSENMRKNVSSSTLNSSSSSHEQDIVTDHRGEDHFQSIQIENIDIFDHKKRLKKKKKHLHKTENLVEIHDLRHNRTYEEFLSNSPSNTSLDLPVNDSLLSLRSVASLPGFLDNESNIRKWENLQSLDVSMGDDRNSSHHWVVGDPSDADSTAPATPNDTNSLPRTSTVSLASTNFTAETASLQSSSFGEETTKSLSKVPSLEEKRFTEKNEPLANFSKDMVEEKGEVEEKRASSKVSKNVEAATITKQTEAQDDLDAEWQYTLPSPPTAFRDASPTNFTDVTNYDTVTFNGLTSDSIVTSPALFEKLESISHTRSETELEEDTVSNSSSLSTNKKHVEAATAKSAKEAEPVKQEEVLTSKYLSLETLEKRKSLVLERELASLKIAQSETAPPAATAASTEQTVKSQRESLRNEIEEVIQNRSRSATLSRTNSQSRDKLLFSATAADSTLPNFKITTYDQPKNKINIFEDDSIRSSNIDIKPTKMSMQSVQSEDLDILRNRNNSLVSASTENIYFAKRNSMDDFIFKRPDLPAKFLKKPAADAQENKTAADLVSRSESFSAQKHIWNRASPVKRSKSHISLDKYNKEESSTEESLHKSNSLYNVSGLQSLEVMRMILPKLGNTPPSSPSEDKQVHPLEQKPQAQAPQPPSPPFIPAKPEVPKEPAATTLPTKKYQYSGPPAINFASWSERPKTQVSIKEDTDYKFNNIKAKFNGAKEQSYPSVNIRVNSSNSQDQVDSGKINIKINSEEMQPNKPISQQASGNVVIKIGSNANSRNVEEERVQKNSLYTRFLNQTTAVGYRKPLGNINGVDKPRPHSIAFDASCPDLSRVPIVRAVELKKPYKEAATTNNNNNNNKSITHILHDAPRPNNTNGTEDDKSKSLGNQYRHSSVYLSNENMNKVEQNGPSKGLSVFTSKPISRGNSFAAASRSNSNGNINVNPVVKGFRDNVNNNNNNFAPFSQHTLRRTENTLQKQKPVLQIEKPSIFETVTLRKTANRHLLPVTLETKSPQVKVTPSAIPPPPPPLAPKNPNIFGISSKKTIQRQLPVEDPRDQLLDAIRNFGGKSGLKAVKL